MARAGAHPRLSARLGPFFLRAARPSAHCAQLRRGSGRRGLVLWDSTHQQIAHLSATYALEILEYMSTDTHGRHYGFVIGTPVIEIDLRDPDAKGIETLSDRITLAPEWCAHLLAALRDNQSMLAKVGEREVADFEQAKRGFIRDLVRWEEWTSALREAILPGEGTRPTEETGGDRQSASRCRCAGRAPPQ